MYFLQQRYVLKKYRGTRNKTIVFGFIIIVIFFFWYCHILKKNKVSGFHVLQFKQQMNLKRMRL